jgi:putative Ca2+/H+ antiporter (TMEM165/GDT1 family)
MTPLTDRENEIWGYIAGTMFVIIIINLVFVLLNHFVREPFVPWLLLTCTSAFFLILSLIPIQKRLARLIVHIIDRNKREREKIDF